MNDRTTDIRTERDFAELLGQLARQIRNTDWTQSTDDVSECLYGMIDYLDNSTDLASPRDGLKWDEIAAMILTGLKKTKAYQTTLPEPEQSSP